MQREAQEAPVVPASWRYVQGEIQQWLRVQCPPTFSISHCMTLVGSHGCGKTTFVRHLAHEWGYWIQWITPDTCTNNKDLWKQLHTFIMPTVDALLEARDPYKVWVVIDNWDNFNAQDRTFFTTLTQFLQSKGSNPYQRRLWILCDASIEKKLSDLGIVRFTLKPMEELDICRVLKHQFPALRLNQITDISEACLGSLPTAIEMARLGGSVTLVEPTQKPLRAWIQPTSQKTIEEWVQWFLQDPWMTPLRFHENLLKELETYTGSKRAKIQCYDRLLSQWIHWDQWMTQGLRDDTEEAKPSLTVLSMAIHQSLYKNPLLKRTKKSALVCSEFTKMLSQMSLQKKTTQTLFQTYQGHRYPVYEYPSHWLNNPSFA